MVSGAAASVVRGSRSRSHVAVGSAVLESLIVHDDGWLAERALELVRTVVSSAVSCSFCVGMNFDGRQTLLTQDDLTVVQALAPIDGIEPLARMAIEPARRAPATPLTSRRSTSRPNAPPE